MYHLSIYDIRSIKEIELLEIYLSRFPRTSIKSFSFSKETEFEQFKDEGFLKLKDLTEKYNFTTLEISN